MDYESDHKPIQGAWGHAPKTLWEYVLPPNDDVNIKNKQNKT